ncbi:hypothetical protein QA601_06315 [Chitinispirillales bacterium ANBcel5]|uniref:hypothetical protein n=1 Tax=Cellulosispirillum alkaliphilum TaxID=3039283 RepID=UPI002A51D6D4|nr:hypothetical protein [Chitinispirillales bacterium ANBcel5]
MATTPHEDYLAVKHLLDEMCEDDIISVNMPQKYYLQESMMAFKRMKQHRDTLIDMHMDWEKAEKIPQLIGSSRELHSQCAMINFPDAKSRKEWLAAKDEAELLLYDLMVTGDFVYADDPHIRGRLSVIREGASNADFIQDLNDVSVLFRENPEPLRRINYDMENVRQAALLSSKLSALLAIATLDRSTSPELRIERDKSFTLLKTSLDPKLHHARWAFRFKRELADQFRVSPPRRRPRKPVTEETPEQEEASCSCE